MSSSASANLWIEQMFFSGFILTKKTHNHSSEDRRSRRDNASSRRSRGDKWGSVEERGEWRRRRDANSSAGAWHSVHVCVCLHWEITWFDFEHKDDGRGRHKRTEGRRERGRKRNARADSPSADGNRGRKRMSKNGGKKKMKESDGIMNVWNENDALG